MTAVQVVAVSRAQDVGYLALADIAALSERTGIDYRIVGGQMVGLHLAAVGAEDPQLRRTVDVDLGVGPQVAGDPALVVGLEELGYRRPGAANRFVRPEPDHHRHRIIDLLAPSYDNELATNQQQGAMMLDAIPGLDVALGRPGLALDVTAELTDASTLRFTTVLPELAAALCLKAFSYQDRNADKDAVDVWRLLVAYRAAFPTAPEWITPTTSFASSMKTAADILHEQFARVSGRGARKASRAPREQVQIRALAMHLLRG